MSPCKGCDKNVERVIVKLRFIGRPGAGRLVKAAPGNYKQGEVVSGPLIWAKVFPNVWELVETVPELRVPSATKGDGVFEDAIFIPDDDEMLEDGALSEADLGDGGGHPTKNKVVLPPELLTPKTSDAEVTLSGSSNVELDAHTKEIIAGYKKQGMYLLDADEGILVSPDEPIEKDTHGRDELKALLDEAGIKYSVKSRTETLARMVQTLESKEDN